MIGIVTIACTAAIFSNVIFERFDLSNRLEENSIEERVSGYGYVDNIVRYNPITGIGPGGYTVALSAVQPDEEVWFYQPVHNTFLLMLSELGLIGFVAFVLWFASIDRLAYRKARTIGGVMSMAIGTSVLMIALFDHYPWSNWSGLVLMAFTFAMMTRWVLEEG